MFKLSENLVQRFIAEKKSGWADTTKKSAVSKFRAIRNYVEQASSVPSLVKNLEQANYAPYSIKQYLILLGEYEQSMETTLEIKDYLRNTSYKFRNVYKEKTRRIQYSEYTQILDQAKTQPEVYNFLVLAGHAGLRRSEALEARWEDFDTTGRFLTVQGKGGKQRQVPFSRARLLTSPRQTSSGFIVGGSSYPLINDFLTSLPTHVTPHDFRAMFATEQLNKGLNIKEVAQIVGHSSISTTARYIRTDLEEISRKMGVTINKETDDE